MGWTYGYEWATKAQLVAALESQYTQSGYTVIDKAGKGGVQYWAVKKGDVSFIVVDLLEYSRVDKCWGYKGMDESMGPYNFDCPLRLLDATVGLPSSYGWRESVRKWHVQNALAKALTFNPGDIVRVGSTAYTVVGPGKTKASLIVADATGKQWRASKRHVQPVREA